MNNIVNLPSEIKFIENKNIYIENPYYYPDGNFQIFLKTYKIQHLKRYKKKFNYT